MNPESEQIEAELQRLRPARPPEEFLARLATPPRVRPAQVIPRGDTGPARVSWWRLFQWLAPAAAVTILGALLIARYHGRENSNRAHLSSTTSKPVIKADRVEIDRQLLAAFDTVARLPGGEPVRFRCRQWMDQLVLRDASTGVIIEQQTPRLEVVPIKFETY